MRQHLNARKMTCMLYMVRFTINIPPMLAYIPYMDPINKDSPLNWTFDGLEVGSTSFLWAVSSQFRHCCFNHGQSQTSCHWTHPFQAGKRHSGIGSQTSPAELGTRELSDALYRKHSEHTPRHCSNWKPRCCASGEELLKNVPKIALKNAQVIDALGWP